MGVLLVIYYAFNYALFLSMLREEGRYSAACWIISSLIVLLGGGIMLAASVIVSLWNDLLRIRS